MLRVQACFHDICDLIQCGFEQHNLSLFKYEKLGTEYNHVWQYKCLFAVTC